MPEFAPPLKESFPADDSAMGSQLDEFVQSPDAVEYGEAATAPEVLEDRLHTVGIVFPEDAKPRGIVSTDDTTKLRVGATIIGSPRYLISPEANNQKVRLHEMMHCYVQAHLIPDQPRVAIEWDHVTDDEMVALAQNVRVLGEDERMDKMVEHVVDSLREPELASYRSNPKEVLQDFADSIDQRRIDDHEMSMTIKLMRAARGRTWEPPNFEAVAAGINQRLVSSLREHMYGELGVNVSVGIDFEEAVAEYFAHHALGAAPSEADEFHQGEQAKKFLLTLSERYPDPHQLADQLESQGVEGVMSTHRDLFNGLEANPSS